MKKTIQHISEIDSFERITELSEEYQELLSKATDALNSSYSPYSGFGVGSAIKLSTGEIVLGSNQENIAYPSGLCAERVALFSAGTNYPKSSIETIVITAKSLHAEISSPVTPCGACRQVMIEVETRQSNPIIVIMAGTNGEIWVSKSVKNLIPFYFSSTAVGRAK